MGAFIAYSEMRPWLDIEEISYRDASLGKELSETFAVVNEKMRAFQEARHAVQQKGKTRGYYKPKGFSKGKGFNKGFSSLKRTWHGSSICPKRQGPAGNGKGGKAVYIW